MAKIGRNDLCPCKSGLKYKKCHGDPVKTQQAKSVPEFNKLVKDERNRMIGREIKKKYDEVSKNFRR
jgi:hypothetical protein